MIKEGRFIKPEKISKNACGDIIISYAAAARNRACEAIIKKKDVNRVELTEEDVRSYVYGEGEPSTEKKQKIDTAINKVKKLAKVPEDRIAPPPVSASTSVSLPESITSVTVTTEALNTLADHHTIIGKVADKQSAEKGGYFDPSNEHDIRIQLNDETDIQELATLLLKYAQNCWGKSDVEKLKSNYKVPIDDSSLLTEFGGKGWKIYGYDKTRWKEIDIDKIGVNDHLFLYVVITLSFDKKSIVHLYPLSNTSAVRKQLQ